MMGSFWHLDTIGRTPSEKNEPEPCEGLTQGFVLNLSEFPGDRVGPSLSPLASPVPSSP